VSEVSAIMCNEPGGEVGQGVLQLLYYVTELYS
jgi:hypothetical protein